MADKRASRRHDLSDRVVLVTGGARRIGAAIVHEMHAAGMDVVIHHRSSTDDATRLAESLNDTRPGSAVTTAADLTDIASLAGVVDAAISRFGRLDLLVNNASSFYPTAFGEIDEASWNELMAINLKAPLFLSQAAFPWIKRSHGLIVNLADIYGTRPLPNHAVYCVAKAGLIMLTHALARDLGPDVRVNAISPGAILWPEGADTDLEHRRGIVASTAFARAGEPSDIARTVLFLMRDATYVTGQNIAVDGGRSLTH